MDDLPTEVLQSVRAALDQPANVTPLSNLELLAGAAVSFLRLAIDKELAQRAARQAAIAT